MRAVAGSAWAVLARGRARGARSIDAAVAADAADTLPPAVAQVRLCIRMPLGLQRRMLDHAHHWSGA